MPTIKQTLLVAELQPNPFQPRDKIKKEDLVELVQSIKTYGVLEPLVIAQTPAGYQIVAGERRWRAAIEAGLTEVPVHIKKTTPRGMLEMALVENVQRINLNPIERAQAFQQLIRDFNFTVSLVAERIGKSAPFVSNSLKLLELPDAITDGLMGQLITEGHARALASIHDEKQMIECYKNVLKESASVRRTEELVRRYKANEKQSDQMRGRPLVQQDDEVKHWQSQIESFFRVPSKIKLTRSRNQTRLVLTFKGSPEQTQDDLEKIIGRLQ
ncbi:MAG: ParB/RepB/Spo0J family partition protein [Patescibacteria group bacterium]